MQVLVVFALSIVSVLACGPATGKVSKKATMTFVVSPPVSWNYGEGAPLAVDQATALKNAQNDLTKAIERVCANNDLDTSAITIGNVDYTPTNVSVLSPTSRCTNPAVEGEYAAYAGTLYYCCSPPLSMVNIKGSVDITSTVDIYQSQWNVLTLQTQEALEGMKVVFNELLSFTQN